MKTKRMTLIVTIVCLVVLAVVFLWWRKLLPVSFQETDLAVSQHALDEMVFSGDSSRCDTLSDSKAKSTCISGTIINKALDRDDISLCRDSYLEESDRVRCERAVLYARTSVFGESACDQSSSDSLKKTCLNDFFNTIPVLKGDIRICGRESDANRRDWCINNFMIRTAVDPSRIDCMFIKGVAEKNDCALFKDIIVKVRVEADLLKKRSLCEPLGSDVFREACQK